MLLCQVLVQVGNTPDGSTQLGEAVILRQEAQETVVPNRIIDDEDVAGAQELLELARAQIDRMIAECRERAIEQLDNGIKIFVEQQS